VALYEHWAEAAKELAKAEKERFDRMNEERDQVLKLQGRVAAMGRDVGVADTDAITGEVASLEGKGIDPDNFGMPAAFAARLVPGLDQETFMRGVAVTPGFKLGTDRAKNLAMIKSALAAGQSPAAKAAFDDQMRANADRVRRDAAADAESPERHAQDRFETVMAELRKAHPEMDERAEGLVRSLLGYGIEDFSTVNLESAIGTAQSSLSPGQLAAQNVLKPATFWSGGGEFRQRRPSGTQLDIGSILGLAQEANDRNARESASGGGGTVVYQTNHIENNATKIQPGDTRRRYSPDQELAPAMP
jgi:hypothetical protein